jgi:WhiB family redox-sensing transcriptional regulator
VTAALSPGPAHWRQWAACARPGIDPEVFFPPKGGSARRARRICASCPVQAPCLADALATSPWDDVHGGIRAGTTARERERMRRRAR